MLHYGGDDAATLRYCPDARTLLLVCLFHNNSGLILVDLEKKVPQQTLKNTDAKYAVTISGGRQRAIQRYEHARVPARCKLTTAAASSRKKQ